jgi:hypothetical protein
MLTHETGIYRCEGEDCDSKYFRKEEEIKISTDHKKLKHYEEVPVKDVRHKIICVECGKELDVGI